MQKIFIHSDSQLKEFCQTLESDLALAVDTEFMRQKTFYAIPALVQIAQQQPGTLLSACIDAPKISDWSPLCSMMKQVPYCLAHSPDQDFEIFDQLFGDWQFTVFDTQIAAALLGEQNQISYAQMIKMTLDLELDKSQSRTDWLRRPLSEAQLDYALADVIHLPDAWELLKAKLVEKNRLEWFLADCNRQISQYQTTANTQNAWRSVKGIKRLASGDFAIAATLAEWREQQAKNANIPRRWMLPDEAILELTLEPKTLKTLSNRWSVLNKHSDTVSKILNNPIKQFEQMDIGEFEPLNADEKKKLSKLKKYCLSQANSLGLEPTSIANRKTLEKIVRGSTDFLDSDNWRHQILQEYVNSNAG